MVKVKTKSIFRQSDLVYCKKTGIYALYFEGYEGKRYIGKTMCKGGFIQRLKCHIVMLKNNKHYSKLFQSFFNDLGINKLRIELILISDDELECWLRETKEINENSHFNTVGLQYKYEKQLDTKI